MAAQEIGEQVEESPEGGIVAPPRQRRSGRRTLLVSAVALAIAGAGDWWITSPATSETTEDAYVDADATSIAPKVRGIVQEVMVRDNQAVQPGTPLVRIDPEEYDARVTSAEADLADAEAAVASAQAALVSLDAEERLAAANVVAARTTIRSSGAEAERAQADRRRYDALVTTGAVARQEVETSRTAAIGAEQAAARARAMLAVSEREAGVTSARRGLLIAALDKAEAQRQRAVAALELARQDQRHTVILAPVAGVVGNRQAQVGAYVQPGTRLLTLVPMGTLYVTANFKETQVRDMHIGQPVEVHVDALGATLTGIVESFAPGSASTFALLPFEPGTGNFTKIVQRVPVRIRLDPGQDGMSALRPGLSVSARVRLAG